MDRKYFTSYQSFNILLCILCAIVLLRSLAQAEESCVGKPSGWKYQDPADCHGFFVCFIDREYQAYCDSGEKFDDVTRTCVKGKCPPLLVPPSNPNQCPANCTAPCPAPCPTPCPDPTPTTTTTTQTTTPTTPPTTTPTPTTTPCPTAALTELQTQPPTLAPDSEATILTGQVDPNIKECLGLPTGSFVRNPINCSIFYVCRGGEAIKQSCGKNQWFDDTHFVCNFRLLVNCPSNQD